MSLKELNEFNKHWTQAVKGIDYRTVNIESWYQELLVNSNRTEGEELIFQVMTQARECYTCMEKSLEERKLQLPEWIKAKD